jgi:hypothetical protein
VAGGPTARRKGEVTLAKEAAARLYAWLDNEQSDDQFAKDLLLVLAHYAKLTRQKVSRKGRYVKGRSYEYEIRDYFNGRNIPRRRVIQSGGGSEKDDLVLNLKWGEQRLELKRVAKLPAYLVNEADATLCRANNGETRVLLSLDRYADLLP